VHTHKDINTKKTEQVTEGKKHLVG